MPQPYDLTNITNSDNIYQLTKAANDISEGNLGLIVLLLGTFLVFFFSFIGFGSKKALAGSSFIASIAAILLRIMGFISDKIMFATFIITAISLIIIRFSD